MGGEGIDSAKWITSVGIDLGTSTTKCVFSRLKIEQRNGLSMLPQFHITDRILSYESSMHPTPFKNETEIDISALEIIISGEYRNAELRPSDVDTGAVIITGETAVKLNADAIVHGLAKQAGAFVVAEAGGDLEAILAGKGSGAEARSIVTQGMVVNIDIGGGTANAAFFEQGSCKRTLNFHIGGRLIMLDSAGTITKVYPAVQDWLVNEGFHLNKGGVTSMDELREITQCWSEMLFRTLISPLDSGNCSLIYGERDGAVTYSEKIAEVWISGGVGRLMEQASPRTMEEAAVYGDIGPLLAEALKKTGSTYPFRLQVPPGAQRATVIGAGVHTTVLSGLTVFVDPHLLPLRNIPVVKLKWPEGAISGLAGIQPAVEEAFTEGIRKFGKLGKPPFAIVLPAVPYYSYPVIREIAAVFIAMSTVSIQPENPEMFMVIICENDAAKALGNCIHVLSTGKLRCICLDQIHVEHGDYIDIGKPLAEEYIPVAIKTLVFSASNLNELRDNEREQC